MKNISSKLFCILLAIILLALSCAKPPVIPEFPIIAWNGPDEKMLSREIFEMIRYAGFTTIFTDYKKEELNRAALNLADSVGITLLISDARIDNLVAGKDTVFSQIDSVIADYRNYRSLWGYFLEHQANAKNFSRLAKIKKDLQQKDPGHISYVSLFPNYASAAEKGIPDYQEYVQAFIDSIAPSFLSFEHFPIINYALRPDYFNNMEIVRAAAQKGGIPFWTFLLAAPYSPYSEPLHSYIRFQAYSALAYGSKCLQYFAYSFPSRNKKIIRNAMIDVDGIPTKIYNYALNVNTEIQNLRFLQDLQPVGVYHSKPVPQGGKPIRADLPIRFIDGQNVMVGFFKGRAGETYVLIVNKNFMHGNRFRIYFAPGVKKIVEIQKLRSFPLRKISWNHDLEEKNAVFIFKAGDGRLFRIEE